MSLSGRWMDWYHETEWVRKHLNKHRIFVFKGQQTVIASLSLFSLSEETGFFCAIPKTSLAGTDDNEAALVSARHWYKINPTPSDEKWEGRQRQPLFYPRLGEGVDAEHGTYFENKSGGVGLLWHEIGWMTTQLLQRRILGKRVGKKVIHRWPWWGSLCTWKRQQSLSLTSHVFSFHWRPWMWC